jgi:uncharacterized protein YkwD
MRKGNLGIFLILSLIFLFGCGKIQSEDISSHTGISIARRGESLITAKPETAQLISQENTLSSENSLKASITISDESLEESPSNSSGGVESTPEPAPSSATLPPPTQVATETIAVSLDVPDQREICAPKFDRSFESEVIELINKERIKEGLDLLIEQSQLTQAARLHSQDMACNRFFSHISPSAGDVVARIAAQGYQYSTVGENIATGYNSPVSVVQDWMESTGHRANIMNELYTQVGVGYAFLDEGPTANYWTLLVGAP